MIKIALVTRWKLELRFKWPAENHTSVELARTPEFCLFYLPIAVTKTSAWGNTTEAVKMQAGRQTGRIKKILDSCFKRKGDTRPHLPTFSSTPASQYLLWKVLPKRAFSPLAETPQCSQECLFHMWGGCDSCCTYRSTSSHTEEGRRRSPSTYKPDEKKEVLVTMATCKKLFSIEKILRKEAHSRRKLQSYSSKGLCLLSWTPISGGFHMAACNMSE